ncbi:tyrosine-protein phosphatase non-receptor type 20 [Waddlia chondrophila 2032/99]|uniref:protein-tyrosine-phosphatase n=1 Tax=Waddlia chondrophila 2032/99 TaxID=765953 RepID=F8LEJ9_9BACT|nr:tyrosine-protein phosphatase non-receptor type 20 [Waddlia chondrophila 2032/99]
MKSTFSILFDSDHIFHPWQKEKIDSRDEPTICRRILGIMLLALSIPFTLGIATGLYTYWAYRKVTQIKQQNLNDLQKKTEEQKDASIGSQKNTNEPLKISIDFDAIETETNTLTFQYTDEPKKRFGNICCPEHTALQINGKTIHANWIQMPDGNTYLSAQAPLLEDFESFWQAAFEKNCLIIDLTTPKDNLMTHSDFTIVYYHSDKGRESLEHCSVELAKTEQIKEHFTLYTYKVTIKGTGKEVQRLHFDSWKDFDGASIDTLNLLIDTIDKKMTDGKIPLVHCRAGVGRTGTLISVLTLRNLQKQGKITQGNVDETVKEVVLTGRKCRGPGFVQSEEQFNVIKASLTV